MNSFKARNKATLYFYRDTAEWALDKPYKSDYYIDDVQIKRTGCVLTCYKAFEYFDDPDHFDYNEQQVVAVFNDGMWILFKNREDLKTLLIEEVE